MTTTAAASSTGKRAAFSAPLRVLVFSLFFFSGATALVYQIAWVRSLTLIFGASHEAVGLVLAAFMGGLALGGFAFGRWSERITRPLALYGLLELGIGVVAFALPTLLRLVDGLYVGVALRVEGVPGSLHLMRAALAFGVLLIPTFLMGGTLPILARLLVTHSAQFGRRLSQLYGINTTGAVVGTVTAGFLMLPTLGVRSTELVAVGLNLAIGVVAWLADYRVPAVGVARRGRPGEPAVAEPGRAIENPWSLWAFRLTFYGTAVSGLCALALEVMWMRGISIAVGTTTYSFSVMLAAFLVGIALGSWLHAAFPLRRIGVAAQFGVVLVGIGASSVLLSQMVPQLPRLAVLLNAWLYPGTSGVRVGTTLLASFAVMLVPCILMGVAFPLAGQARARIREQFGRSVGDVVGLNTLGAIVGSLAAGFVLIPRLGLQRGMLLVSSVILSYGLIVLGFAAAGISTSLRRRMLPVSAALAAGALVLPAVLPDWDIRVLASFRNNARGATATGPDGRLDWERILGNANVLYYREGRGSNVSVVESNQTRAIMIDGKSVASDSLTDMQHELLLGHLPVLMHPAPRSAAVIGLGAGITLAGVLAHPSVESVVLVEIEPAVIGGARQFAHVNEDALDDPRLQIVFQDGRNYLRTTARRFDVITADPIHPWAHGASYLYTSEYYAIVASRLAEGGVMCQWLPLYELSAVNVKSVVATFSDNFRHTTLWQTAYDAVLIGSDAPLDVDSASLRDRLEVPAVARQLSQVGLGDPLSFLSELALDGAGIARLSEGAKRNTDDNLYLEFSSPLSIGTPEVFDNIRAINEQRVALRTVLSDLSGLLPPDRSDPAVLDEYRWAKSGTVQAQIDLQAARSDSSAASYPPIIQRLNGIVERVPDYGRARSLLSMAWTHYGLRLLGANRNQEGVDALRRAVAVMPVDAEANYQLATALSRLGRLDDALPFFEAATRLRPRFAWAYHNHGVALIQMRRFERARELLLKAVELRPRFAEANHHLAVALWRTGSLGESERNFELALKLKPSLPGLHNNYAALLVEQGRYPKAVTLLEKGLALDAKDVRVARRLAWLLATVPDDALRDGARAVRLAQQANQATGARIPQVLDTLAASLAETGRYPEAIELAGRAAELASRQGQHDLAREIRGRISVYREGRPFRL